MVALLSLSLGEASYHLMKVLRQPQAATAAPSKTYPGAGSYLLARANH